MSRIFGTFLWTLCALGMAGCAASSGRLQRDVLGGPTAPGSVLPDTVVPKSYALELALSPDEQSWVGELSIEVDIHRHHGSRLVWLHASGLELLQASFEARESLAPEKLRIHPVAPFVGVESSDLFPQGLGTLRLQFKGRTSPSDTRGLVFLRERGQRWVLSDFSQQQARRVIPCFDEPRFKALWKVSVRVPEKWAAFSNAPKLRESVPERGVRLVEFEKTAPLAPQHIALAAGIFDAVDAGRVGSTPLRVSLSPGKNVEARYLVRTVGSVLDKLEDYFAKAFPFRKLDVVVIPAATLPNTDPLVHPGLIVLSARQALARPEEETLSFQRSVDRVLTRALVQHWVGHSLTAPSSKETWWTDAMTSWLESSLLQVWKPYWRMDAENARRRRQAFENDDRNGFEDTKGAALLSMLENWLGPDALRRTAQQCVAKYAYGAFTFQDFLRELSTGTAGSEAVAVLESFIQQPGFPVVTFKLRCENSGGARMSLTQKRFAPPPAGAPAHAWRIPVCVRYRTDTGDTRRACTVLGAVGNDLTLPGARCPAGWISNAGGTGYYVSQTEFPERGASSERLAWLTDQALLVKTGQQEADSLLRALSSCVRGNIYDAELVAAAAQFVQSLEGVLPDRSHEGYVRYIQTHFGPPARKLGFSSRPGELPQETTLRARVLRLVGEEGGDVVVGQQAIAASLRWLEDATALEDGVVESVLVVAARHGGASLHQRLLRAAKAETQEERRQVLLSALAHFRQPDLLRKNLEALREFDVRQSLRFLTVPMSTPETRPVARAFLTREWDNLVKDHPGLMLQQLPALLRGTCQPSERAQMDAFFSPRVSGMPGGKRALSLAFESVDQCIAWVSLQQDSLSRFFASTL